MQKKINIQVNYEETETNLLILVDNQVEAEASLLKDGWHIINQLTGKSSKKIEARHLPPKKAAKLALWNYALYAFIVKTMDQL